MPWYILSVVTFRHFNRRSKTASHGVFARSHSSSISLVLGLQFWSSDPYNSRAIHHTGRFNIKFRVQFWHVRADYLDSTYAVKFREHCLMIYFDDKANVPVGKLGKPQATVVRGHNRSLAPVCQFCQHWIMTSTWLG